MVYKKTSDGDNSYLQNKFTAYVVKAVRNRKRDILRARIKRHENEMYVDFQDFSVSSKMKCGCPENGLRKKQHPLKKLIFKMRHWSVRLGA